MPLVESRGTRLFIIVAVAAIGIGAVLLLPPIAQPAAYHHYADQRSLFGVPHFWNVVSSLAFTAAGLHGLRVARRSLRAEHRGIRRTYLATFFSAVLIGFGSAWYHLAPGNTTLAWDRLPMAMAFTALFAAVIADYLDPRWGERLLLPLLLAGILSVLYWHLTEQAGRGDLRPYLLVQFLPVVLLPLILLLFPAPRLPTPWLWSVLAVYLAAKLLEHFDAALMTLTGAVSGHTLKHVVAAAALFLLAGALRHRDRPLAGAGSGKREERAVGPLR
jgi:hypothetical protein